MTAFSALFLRGPMAPARPGFSEQAVRPTRDGAIIIWGKDLSISADSIDHLKAQISARRIFSQNARLSENDATRSPGQHPFFSNKILCNVSAGLLFRFSGQ